MRVLRTTRRRAETRPLGLASSLAKLPRMDGIRGIQRLVASSGAKWTTSNDSVAVESVATGPRKKREVEPMIRVVLDTGATANVRFTASPALETVSLIRLVRRLKDQSETHEPWIKGALAKIKSIGIDELADTVSSDTYYPDFLTPAPDPGNNVGLFESQLNSIRATPLRQFEREMELAYHGRSQIWTQRSTEQARDLLAAQLARCHREVVRPIWRRIGAISRNDIARRSQQSSVHGLAAAIDGLHPRIRFRDSGIEFTSVFDEELPVADAGLVFVSTVFANRQAGIGVEPPGPMQIVYPARGSGLIHLAEHERSSLATVLGDTRVEMLAAAMEPTTTTDLAARLDIAPATVSYHLTALTAVGWLTRRRIGRKVEYEATELGRTVLKGDLES